MVNITDVKQILQFAIDAEIKVFLDGGWGFRMQGTVNWSSSCYN